MPDAGPPSPAALHQVLIRFADLLETRGIGHMIVGAVAVGAWGRPRATADIDVTVLLDEAGLEELGRAAQTLGLEIDHQWLQWNPLLQGLHVRMAAAGVVVDAMRPRDDHEATAIQRRRVLTVAGQRIWFASPEDLILMKLKAGRPRDFEDAVSVIVAQRDALDEGYMTDWASRLGIADELAYVLDASA